MPEPEQLDIFGGSTPFDQLEPRTARAGQRGGSAEATTVPDNPERYIDILGLLLAQEEGATDDEMQQTFIGVHPGTLSKRRLRLERALLLAATERTRKTRRGIEAMVFEITDAGRSVLREWESRSR